MGGHAGIAEQRGGIVVADDRADGAREAVRPVRVPRQHLEQIAQPYVGGIAARRGVGLIGASIRIDGQAAVAPEPVAQLDEPGVAVREQGVGVGRGQDGVELQARIT
ncbi:hypothetical protein D3C72_1162910 [compost metagenome]